MNEPIATFGMSGFRPNLYYDVVYKESMSKPMDSLHQFAFEAMGTDWEDEPKVDIVIKVQVS